MSRKLNLVSAVTFAMAASALGLSIYSVVAANQAPANTGVAELRAEVGTKHNALLDSFESRVEESLESIIERRRAEAAKASGAVKLDSVKNPSSESKNSFVSGSKGDQILTMNEDGQVVYGNPDAAVTVMTFEDFRCSFCAQYHPSLQGYVDQSDGNVNWIYKPYPILGQASEQLALAGECVALVEGPEAFWDYAEQAYDKKNWNAALKATSLENPEAVVQCMQNGDAQDRIDTALSDGRQLNITGTPASVFRNNATEEGALIPGFLQPHQIDQVVQEVLND